MRQALLSIGVILFAGPGCDGKSAPAPPVESAAPPPAAAPASTTRGEIAGVRYLEHLTGGARTDERVPMIVALHPMGGDPEDLLQMLSGYRRRARLILPYGHPSGGRYVWFDSVRDDVEASLVASEADRLAVALAALSRARPTVGKPLVTGFSQGGMMTFALAVTHPEALGAAFPISGRLPRTLYPSAAVTSTPARSATLPPIAAFHGAADLAVPTADARASIAELRQAGYTAELREYAGVVHATSDEEIREIVERIGRAADALTTATP